MAGKAKNKRDNRCETGRNIGLSRIVLETKTPCSEKLGRRNKVEQTLFYGKYNTGLGPWIGPLMRRLEPLLHPSYTPFKFHNMSYAKYGTSQGEP